MKNREGKGNKIFSICIAALMFSMLGIAFANTGCVSPFETMDNMVVTASISTDADGDFSVDGAVTSATVKALGYVSSSEAAKQSFEDAADTYANSGLDPSLYDRVRYDNTNRRIVDYERASGQYTHYIGKEHWYSFFDDDASDVRMREVDNKDYLQSVSLASGMTLDNVFGGGSFSPLGQQSIDLTFDENLFKSFDMSTLTEGLSGGAVANMSTFGFQQFVWKMDEFSGEKFGVDNSKVWVAPTDEDYITVTATVNGTPIQSHTAFGDFDPILIPFVYYKVNAAYQSEYYIMVLTDALRYIQNYGEELRIDVSVTMVGYPVTTWSDVEAGVAGWDEKLVDSVTDKFEQGWDDFEWQFETFTNSVSGSVSSAVADMVQNSIGNVNVPFTSDLLTGGLSSSVQDSIERNALMASNYEDDSNFMDAVGYMRDHSTDDEVFALWNARIADDLIGYHYHWYAFGIRDSADFHFSYSTRIDDVYDFADRISGDEGDILDDVRSPKHWNPDLGFLYPSSADEGENLKDGDRENKQRFMDWWDSLSNRVLREYNEVREEMSLSLFDELNAFDITAYLSEGEVKTFAGTATQIKTLAITDSGFLFGAFDDTSSLEAFGNADAIREEYEEAMSDLSAEMWENFNSTISLYDENLSFMRSEIDALESTLLTQGALMENLSAQMQETTEMLSELLVQFSELGFNMAFNEDAGIWLINVDWQEFESNFNIIQSGYLSTSNYMFEEDFYGGQMFVPLRVDVSNSNMLDDMFVVLEKRQLGLSESYTPVSTINCSQAAGTYYNIPVDANILGTGLFDFRANITFTNGTGSPADDVSMLTATEPGFGGNVRILEKSLEDMLQMFNGINPLFINGDSRELQVVLQIYDVDDDMALPPIAFVGGNTRKASFAVNSASAMKWSVNYIREHTYRGSIIILDEDGDTVYEEPINEFTLKNGAYSQNSRRSDTLSISDYDVGEEYAKFGEWSKNGD